MMRFLTLVALLTACTTTTAPTTPACGTAAVTASCTDDLPTEAACLAEGGCWGAYGIAGTVFCNCREPDAGEPCTSHDDCSGFCQGPSGAACADATEGTCSELVATFGCHCRLDDTGNVELCVD